MRTEPADDPVQTGRGERIVKKDMYRPVYHFLPERNWMNDPNGTIFHEGYYHLFYQHNPNGDQWGTIHWGHARSADLVDWEHLPVALYPSEELGELHCFSGCAVLDGEEPKILYTSIGEGERNASTGAEQWLATSRDGMRTWTKHPQNPVMTTSIHGGIDIREWRDPFAWREGEDWFMVVGGAHEGKGCVAIYKSADLVSWSFLNILYADPSVALCECPLFYREGDTYVLIYSPGKTVKYVTGTLAADYTFIPDTEGVIDHGSWDGYYAPNTLVDGSGRRILFGWMPEASRENFLPEAGWAGVQALPRELEVTASGKLAMRPVPELRRLRGRSSGLADLIAEGESVRAGIEGRAVEIIAEFDLAGTETAFGIEVLRSGDGREATRIVVDPGAGLLTIDRSRSSLSPLPRRTPVTGRYEPADGRLKLHVFVDHSTIEVFGNETACLSARVYPTLALSAGVGLFGDSVVARLARFDAWELSEAKS
ncbi:glycoside hydrolase family 32 protein [Paenibacillus arenilitoris]|uniref:beta-fructofuranosidase n=1 Tax=Paenibacillus arenilitoris TaxID=2772299 RepID=A0A927CJL1_9BACL|nr:glycoside hydrolase family 32 protein [Paenibacillus arenilitoris]MBD2869279.1 glycoside hydrolase family 32 protein [Paenibacillus arenilitoris]